MAERLAIDGYAAEVGESYRPVGGDHEGHLVTVIADDMPSVRFNEVKGHFDRWVECECGKAWAFVLGEA